MTGKKGRSSRRLSFEGRVLLMALMTGLCGSLIAVILLWSGDFTPKVRWTLAALIGMTWLSFAFRLRERVVRPLQTVSNLLSALREGDFSIRARGARRGDVLGDVMLEVNALVEMLHGQRLDALEATVLLRKIMGEIEVAIFAFDASGKLGLVNRAGERLMAQPAERLLGRNAAELELLDCLRDDAPMTISRNFPGGAGRWETRRSEFRQGGLPLQLLVITDLSRALREEERQAWQRLIRVMGHELNNSLAPIRSLAGSLEALAEKEPRPADWEEDLKKGLAVISARSESLNRFMEAYARLARLPAPKLREVELGALVRRVAGLESRARITLRPGPELLVRADGDQLEQLLINLLRNAADAVLETHGSVTVGWGRNATHFDVWVEDEGPGISSTSNLFVPFFTTKPGGSGIGLVLSRQIAEAHGGTLTVENRRRGRGCAARLRIPLR
ncbi:MAG TPA: ATP-binding protein [Candidatus Polarisedimenticolia bacterium]|jgi:nitrogen fixation/metabolism regulation signal transduction histidine kinase|nr:ATP-binding protein [Candidatus Polarisedimenticolia bacterium]